MAYCAVTDIQLYSKATYDTTTRPTTAAVQAMIDNNEGRINAELTKQGITPPTSCYGFTELKQTAIYCTLADVCRANHTESESVTHYQNLCDAGLKQIPDSPGLFDDSMTGSVSGSTKEEPIYEWGETQW